MQRFSSLPLIITALSVGCGESPRDLEWEVRFGASVDDARAVRVQSRILSGGCDGSTELYITDIYRGTATGPAPGILPPGRYGFDATAWDDGCVPYAHDCREYTLPVADGEGVALVLEDQSAGAACAAEFCVMGECQGSAVDGGLDAADSTPDAPADAMPPAPLVVAMGTPVASPQAVDPTTDAVLLASGTATFAQVGGGDGWVSSQLLVDGLRHGASFTSRDGSDGESLHAASTAVGAVGGDPFALSHLHDANGYRFVSERWAWAALDASQVTSESITGDATEAIVAVAPTEEVIAIVNGWAVAPSSMTGGELSLTLEVDGSPCGRATHHAPDTTNVDVTGASFFCVTPLTTGPHTLRTRATTNRTDVGSTALDYVLIPRDLVGPFGTSTDPSTTLDLPGPGVLVAYGWQSFSGTMGWAEVTLRVGGSLCTRSRSTKAPTDLSVGCVWPVAGAEAVEVLFENTREGPIVGTDVTIGWVFLPGA